MSTPKINNNPSLLPCPFCGRQAKIEELGPKGQKQYSIFCSSGEGTSCVSGPFFRTIEDARDHWNTRHAYAGPIKEFEDWVVIDPKNIPSTVPDAEKTVLGMDGDGWFHSVYWDGEGFIESDTEEELFGIFAWTDYYPDPIDFDLKQAADQAATEPEEGRS